MDIQLATWSFNSETRNALCKSDIRESWLYYSETIKYIHKLVPEGDTQVLLFLLTLRLTVCQYSVSDMPISWRLHYRYFLLYYMAINDYLIISLIPPQVGAWRFRMPNLPRRNSNCDLPSAFLNISVMSRPKICIHDPEEGWYPLIWSLF